MRLFIVGGLFLSLVLRASADNPCTVNWTEVHQRIDGFGASSAWIGTWTTNQADMFFTTNSGSGKGPGGTNFAYTGIGLSLLRNRIAPNGTTAETDIMQKAQARGARVWSTPWSPPASMKSNNDVNNGGSLLPVNYQAYASQVANYVRAMRDTYGINLYALSVQNEPTLPTSYESCVWTAQQIHDFVPYLYGALLSNGVASTKIMLPEHMSWDFALAATTMNDSNTAAQVGILAGHGYGSSAAAVNAYGKALWETEESVLSGDDATIANGLMWAAKIHAYMTVAEVNAWHYWWLIPWGTSSQGLCDTNGVPAKRMYTTGNFSRFVRPDYYRIGVDNGGSTLASAFKDAQSGRFALVVINSNSGSVTQTFTLAGAPVVDSVTPWITSDTLSLASQTAVAVTNASFIYTIPGKSVVTFSGEGTHAPPSGISLSSYLAPTNGATDVAVQTVLDWADSSGADRYDVFLWLSSSAKPATPTTNVLASTCDPQGNLLYSTNYSWQVVATNRYGSTTGAVSTFSTRAALPPAVPSSPVPTNGATGVAVQTVLAWVDSSGADGYSVFLWLSSAAKPAIPTTHVFASTYDPPGNLPDGTTFNWQVVATNGPGSNTGAVWTFTTQVQPTMVLQADLNGNRGTADTGPVHSGWSGITGTEDAGGPWTHSAAIGGILIDINVNSGNAGWRKRNAPTAGTLSDMYQSLLFAAGGFDLKLSGLIPGRQYQLILYSWDSDGGVNNIGDAHWHYSLAGNKSNPVDAGYVWQPNTGLFTPVANTGITPATKGTGVLSTTFTATGSTVDFFTVSGPVAALNGFQLLSISEPASSRIHPGTVLLIP